MGQSDLSPIKIFVTNFLRAPINGAPVAALYFTADWYAFYDSFSGATEASQLLSYNDVVWMYLTRHLEGFVYSAFWFEIMQMLPFFDVYVWYGRFNVSRKVWS